MVGWNRVSEYWKNTLDGRREAPLDPEVDFVTHISRATMDGEPLPGRRHPRHHGHPHARQPRHAEEPTGLVHVPPRHPSRGPAPDRGRPVADPRRRRGVPAGLSHRQHGPEAHAGLRLPWLPDEEGRHGAAQHPVGDRATHASSRSPRRSSSTARPTGTSPSEPASTVASAPTSPGPSCSMPSRSGTPPSPTTRSRPTSH